MQGRVERLTGKRDKDLLIIKNTKIWMGPNVIVRRGNRGRIRDYGRVWDFDGMSTEICPID